MARPNVDKRLVRILDANLNRAREGLRVCEEVARLGWDDVKLSESLRRVRHDINQVARKLPVTRQTLLLGRNTNGDVGRRLKPAKLSNGRNQIQSLFVINMQRSKEALRVLEEGSRTLGRPAQNSFHQLRFKLYALETRLTQYR